MKTKMLPLVTLLLTVSIPTAQAAEINWNGFATLAGGITPSSDDRLNGYDDTFGFSSDSKVGLQVTANMGDGLSVVAQIVSRGNNAWNTEFEWAYIGYQATDNLKILVGKQRIPFYNYSDYLDVSYVYPWITPPEDTYASVPFSTANGVGIIYNSQLGEVDSTIHVVYGRNSEDLFLLGEGRESDMKNLTSLSWALEYDWLNFRVGYTRADMQFVLSELEQLAGGWAQIGSATGNPEWTSFDSHIVASDDNNTGSFTDMAFGIDYKDFILIGEYTVLGTAGTITVDENKSYFLTVGKRMGDFLPHFTYGASEGIPTTTEFLNPARGTGIPPVNELLATTEGIFNSSTSDADYWGLGLRWNFHPSAAFKVEYKKQTDNLTDDSNGLLRFAIVTVF